MGSSILYVGIIMLGILSVYESLVTMCKLLMFIGVIALILGVGFGINDAKTCFKHYEVENNSPNAIVRCSDFGIEETKFII